MRLVKVKLENFRACGPSVEFDVDPLTVFVGKNDAGKSTLLDALNIFFNGNGRKGEPDTDDFNVSREGAVSISCIFDELPSNLVIDDVSPTRLEDEYLLNGDGHLEIKKVFPKQGASKVYAVAQHPQNSHCCDLLSLSITKLKDVAKKHGVELENVDQRISGEIRRAIWAACQDLCVGLVEIDLAKEAAKDLWEKIKPMMPVFAIFRSDRPSTDQDAEAQDPMNFAIKEAVKQQQHELDLIQEKVTRQVQEIADRTVVKIREMAPELASELTPRVRTKSWDTIFSVSLTGDEGIPINKRGSGTRRLILLNFFRAKAEHDSTCRGSGIIYAVEEPETSQHPNNQKMLVEAFEDLVLDGTCQILITTHTPVLARRFRRENLRIVTRGSDGTCIKSAMDDEAFKDISNSIGILPDHDVKLFVGVEGKYDIHFLRTVSRILSQAGQDVPDLEELERSGSIVFVPCGGSSVELWVERLAHLNRPEFYIFDRDNPPPLNPHYHSYAEDINARSNATAVHTNRRELENYIHLDAIIGHCSSYSGTGLDFEDVPSLFAQAMHDQSGSPTKWGDLDESDRRRKESKAKRRLNLDVAGSMTAEQIIEVDREGELRGWLSRINELLR